MTNEVFNENETLNKCISDLLNNNWDDCSRLLTQYKDASVSLNYCNCIFSMMKSVMLLDNSQLSKTVQDLEECMKMCKIDDSLLSTIKRAIGWSSSQYVKVPYEERIMRDIITADCKFYSALLIILRKEGATYLFQGVLGLRRAWKSYSYLQRKLFDLYRNLEPRAEEIYGSDPNKLPIIDFGEYNDEDGISLSNKIDDDANEYISEDDLSLDVVKRLLGGVSFGYGVMQLAFSFLPPHYMNLVKLLGFEGDRSAALKALYFTSHSNDMRSQFADIVLIAYSILGPQLFGHSEIEMYLSQDEIDRILRKNLAKYPKSSIFLFLEAKKYQLMLKNYQKAFEYLDLTQQSAFNIPEIKCLCSYEMVFLNLVNLDYNKAFEAFNEFKKYSRWSRSFNIYVSIILKGCLNDFDGWNSERDALNLPFRKNFLEKFARRRLDFIYGENRITKELCELLTIELLYLWMYIPYCQATSLKAIFDKLRSRTDQNTFAIRCLIEGAIKFELRELDEAETLFKESLSSYENGEQIKISKYIKPYANCQLTYVYIEKNDLDRAIEHLTIAKTYTEYDLRSRLQAQLRSLQRRIDYYTSYDSEWDTHL